LRGGPYRAGARRQFSGHIGAGTGARFDEAIAEQMFVCGYDNISPHPQLPRKIPARWQTKSCRQPTLQDGAAQTGMYLERLAAARRIEPQRKVEQRLSPLQSGW
jgi:hypothetical protein